MLDPDPVDRPALKVSRAVAACSRCRTAKIRCDGALPACSACVRAGRADSCSTPGTPSGADVSQGQERNYVAVLESQVKRLERQMQEVRGRHGTNGHHVRDRLALDNIHGGPTLTRTRRREAVDFDNLVSNFGFLSINATSRDFAGLNSAVTFASLLLASSLVEPFPLHPHSATLPARSRLPRLVQPYFDSFYLILPVFPETSFWTAVDLVYADAGRFAQPSDHWTLHLVLALALIPYNPSAARAHVATALTHSEAVLQPGHIRGLQAILLLANYALYDPCHLRAWFLVGHAGRIAIDLGLHAERSVHARHGQSPAERSADEGRRCVFFALYVLDRYVSTALGRPLSFSDESVSVKSLPPPAEPPIQDPELPFLHSPAHLHRLYTARRIVSRVYHQRHYGPRHPPGPPNDVNLREHDQKQDQESHDLAEVTRVWNLCTRIRTWFIAVHPAVSAPCSSPGSSLHFNSSYLATIYELEYLFSLAVILEPHLNSGSYQSHRYSTSSATTISPAKCFSPPIVHAQNLYVDYSLAFIYRSHAAMSDTDVGPFMTYLDVWRVTSLVAGIVRVVIAGLSHGGTLKVMDLPESDTTTLPNQCDTPTATSATDTPDTTVNILPPPPTPAATAVHPATRIMIGLRQARDIVRRGIVKFDANGDESLNATAVGAGVSGSDDHGHGHGCGRGHGHGHDSSSGLRSLLTNLDRDTAAVMEILAEKGYGSQM